MVKSRYKLLLYVSLRYLPTRNWTALLTFRRATLRSGSTRTVRPHFSQDASAGCSVVHYTETKGDFKCCCRSKVYLNRIIPLLVFFSLLQVLGRKFKNYRMKSVILSRRDHGPADVDMVIVVLWCRVGTVGHHCLSYEQRIYLQKSELKTYMTGPVGFPLF